MTPSLPPRLSSPPSGWTLDACAECDHLLWRPCASNSRDLVICPTCGAKQTSSLTFKASKTLAFSLTGLILAIPANIYPQMSFSLLGHPNHYTLLSGATHLIENGFWFVGALVLLCTVVAPLLVLLLTFLTVLAWQWHLSNAVIKPLLKLYQYLAHWVMLDVYLLAVIVAVVKLQDMGDFAFTWGFYCFVLLLFILLASMLSFNTHGFWRLLEERDNASH